MTSTPPLPAPTVRQRLRWLAWRAPIAVLAGVALVVIVPPWFSPAACGPEHSRFQFLCQSCHPGWDEPADGACLVCHADKREPAITTGAKPDLHAIIPMFCRDCHPGHPGRGPSTLIPPKSFDHRVTGFTLRPHHAHLDCSRCHLTPGRYRGLSADCQRCHATGLPTISGETASGTMTPGTPEIGWNPPVPFADGSRPASLSPRDAPQ